MRSILARILPAIAVSLAIPPAAAHHAGAMFDPRREITLLGNVVEFEWVNPHVYIDVETLNDLGEKVVWTIEGSSTSLLRRVGWSQDSLGPGDRVTVTANPARDAGRKFARAISIEKVDGTVLAFPNLGNIQALTPKPARRFVASDLSGTWLPDPSSPRSQFPDQWPLTGEGLATLARYDESLNPFNDCVPLAAPLLMVSSGFIKSIEIGEESVVIRAENAVRTIHLKSVSHDGAAFTVQGHSIGRWEGDVLVIDTTHFSDHLFAYGRGLASGAQKHLIERLELSADGTRLEYSFEVEDPEYLSRPVTGTFELVYRPDLPNPDDRCDPEIARRYLGD